jgi:hypothetical protein
VRHIATGNRSKSGATVLSVTAGTSRSKSHSSARPALTTGATSHQSTCSIITNNVKIVSCGSEKAKVEPAPKTITVLSDGGLSDCDETNGVEWLAAVNSPLKGQNPVTSEVSLLSVVA